MVSIGHVVKFSTACDGIKIYGDEGRVFWDERCRSMFSIPAYRQVGYQDLLAYIHPADRATIADAVTRALAGTESGEEHYGVPGRLAGRLDPLARLPRANVPGA